MTDNELQDVYSINVLHVVYLAKVLVEKMVATQGKQAIVVTSSGLANMAMPGVNSYSSSKVCVSRFCEALAEEVSS